MIKITMQESFSDTHCEIVQRWMSQNPITENFKIDSTVRHQAINGANFGPDICRLFVPLGHEELIS